VADAAPRQHAAARGRTAADPRAAPPSRAAATASDPRAGFRRLASGPLAALFGSIWRLVWVTAVLSAVLVVTPWLPEDRGGLLVGFGLLALATLLASLLEGLGRGAFAVLGVLVAVGVEWAMPATFAGAPLVVGSAVGVAVLLGPAVALLARPARTLATALWIT
jgi:hypothetical protein